MINLFLSLVQMYLESNSKSAIDTSRDFLSNFKERGKDYAIAFVTFFLAALFIFAGLVLFIVELGLQIDKGLFFSFSGLMISSSLLIGTSVFFICLSLFVLREPKEKQEQKPNEQPADELKKEVYNIALMFLREFKENHSKPKAKE